MCGLGIDLAGDACVDRIGEENGEGDVCNTRSSSMNIKLCQCVVDF